MTGAPEFLLEAKKVGQRYGRFDALTDISFAIDRPTVTAVVGKNGSGKSTLMRILCGLEKPSAGSVSILGAAPYDNGRVLRDVTFIDEKFDFDFTLPLGRILEKCAYMDERFDLEFAREAADKFGLSLKKRQMQCSKGMRSQFGIIVGLAFDRPITLMDEPISGLDESSRRTFYSLLIRAQCDCPRVFMISTHLLGEFEKYADTFMVIAGGRLAAYDKRKAFERLFVRVTGAADIVDRVTSGPETYDVKALAGVKSVTVPDLIDAATFALYALGVAILVRRSMLCSPDLAVSVDLYRLTATDVLYNLAFLVIIDLIAYEAANLLRKFKSWKFWVTIIVCIATLVTLYIVITDNRMDNDGAEKIKWSICMLLVFAPQLVIMIVGDFLSARGKVSR